MLIFKNEDDSCASYLTEFSRCSRVDVKVYPNANNMETFVRVSIFIKQNGKEIQLTIERLNATYVISRELKCVGVNMTVGYVGEHYGLSIFGMSKTQGMAKLMNCNKEQVGA